MRTARTAGLVLGYVADQVFPMPAQLSPAPGAGYAAGLVGGALTLGVLAERRAPSPTPQILLTAVATWTVLGGRRVERDARAARTLIEQKNLAAARRRVGQMEPMAGRDLLTASPAELSRASVEALAVATSDTVVTPLIWGAVAGVPGLLAARAAGIAVAEISRHPGRSDAGRWAAARLDDLVSLPGSRLTGVLAVATTPHRALPIIRGLRADSWKHPRPHAGVPEAAFAGAVGVQLGGVSRYDGNRIQRRAVIGPGSTASTASPATITAAIWLARRIGLATVLGVVAVPFGWAALRRRGHSPRSA